MAKRNTVRSSQLKERIARTLLGTGMGYFAASWTASRWLTRRTRGKLKSTPADYGLEAETLTLRTDDGIRLSGWLVEPANAHATAALFHGMRQSRAMMLDRL